MEIRIPQKSLVLLIGISGSGKSTFARKHFKSTEILSSDYFRSLIADDENDQSISAEAFEVLHFIAERRLKKGNLTVIDATNLSQQAREPLLNLSQKYFFPAVAILFNLPETNCLTWNQLRPNRQVDPLIINKQFFQLQETLNDIINEDFVCTYMFKTKAEIQNARVILIPPGTMGMNSDL